MESIKSFIYLDEEKMYSISSQVFEGVTEYIIDVDKDKLELRDEQKGKIASGKVLANIIKTEDSEVKKRYLHDYSYKLFEECLISEKQVLEITSNNIQEINDEYDKYQFVKIKGKTVFNDMNSIQDTIKNFNSLGLAFAYVTNYSNIKELNAQEEEMSKNTKDRNEKAKLRAQKKSITNVSKLAKESGLNIDDKFLKYLSDILDYGFKDQFEVKIQFENEQFTANLIREYLREKEDLLIRKYSRFSEKEFTLFGVITQSKNQSIKDEIEVEKEDENNEKCMKEAVMTFVEAIYNIEHTFIGKLNSEIIIDPIAIYREL